MVTRGSGRGAALVVALAATFGLAGCGGGGGGGGPPPNPGNRPPVFTNAGPVNFAENATGTVVVRVTVEGRVRHHGGWCAAVLLFLTRARRHADVAPCVPIDYESASRRSRGAIDREGIKEGICRGIVNLTRKAEARGNGREQDKEVERLIDQSIEVDGTGNLRVQDAPHRA